MGIMAEIDLRSALVYPIKLDEYVKVNNSARFHGILRCNNKNECSLLYCIEINGHPRIFEYKGLERIGPLSLYRIYSRLVESAIPLAESSARGLTEVLLRDFPNVFIAKTEAQPYWYIYYLDIEKNFRCLVLSIFDSFAAMSKVAHCAEIQVVFKNYGRGVKWCASEK
jgi:hypothetical protein